MFVALRPDARSLALLAPFATVDPPELHLTLAFLGRGLVADEARRVREVVRTLAAAWDPLVGHVTGRGVFPGRAEDVHYAALRGPAFTVLRADLVQALARVGVAVDETFAFVPHVTLGKVPHGSTWPRSSPPPGVQVFRELLVHGGDAPDGVYALARRGPGGGARRTGMEPSPLARLYQELAHQDTVRSMPAPDTTQWMRELVLA